MVGGLIAICLALKEFGCLFLLFSNPRIPLLKLPCRLRHIYKTRELGLSVVYVVVFFSAIKYWEAWCLVAIFDRPRRSALRFAIGASKSF